MDKRVIPFRCTVYVEERLGGGKNRWHAQFVQPPLGWFRARGVTPAQALARAWKLFRKEIDPRERWWAPAQDLPHRL